MNILLVFPLICYFVIIFYWVHMNVANINKYVLVEN